MSPREIATEQALELLAATARDELTFRILCGASEAPLETTLFHAQQAIDDAGAAVAALMAWARSLVDAGKGVAE